MIRKAVFDGQFYPEKKESLSAFIENFIPAHTQKMQAKGLILPHAGYIYSGKVAAITIGKITAKKTVVILGPNHTGRGAAFGVWQKGGWMTPLGIVSVDEELASAILKDSPALNPDTESHLYEHSIEVELPLLQHFFGEFSLVAISCASASLSLYQKIGISIAKVITAQKKDALIIASSDLTHYENEEVARRKDRFALDAITGLDEEKLIDTINKNKVSMCGSSPVAIAISCLKQLRAQKAHVALYQTSAETNKHSRSVVGYAGVIIS